MSVSLTRRFLLGSAVAAVTTALLPVGAALASEVFVRNGAAIRGYDSVAYHTMGKPVKGNAAFATEWNGATWHFSSAENKALFDGDPEKYAPAYGGYCAYAVAYGSTAKTEPEAFKIVDGQLYLNYDKRIQKKWEGKQASFIQQSEANWPGIKAGLGG